MRSVTPVIGIFRCYDPEEGQDEKGATNLPKIVAKIHCNVLSYIYSLCSFKCNQCDHAFMTVMTLKNHEKSEGAAHTPETSMAKNPLLCTGIFKEELYIHGTLH